MKYLIPVVDGVAINVLKIIFMNHHRKIALCMIYIIFSLIIIYLLLDASVIKCMETFSVFPHSSRDTRPRIFKMLFYIKL